MSLQTYKKETGFSRQNFTEQSQSLSDYFSDNIAPSLNEQSVEVFRQSFVNKHVTAKRDEKEITKESLDTSIFQLAPSISEGIIPENVRKSLDVLKPEVKQVEQPQVEKDYRPFDSSQPLNIAEKIINQWAVDYKPLLEFGDEFAKGIQTSNLAETGGHVFSESILGKRYDAPQYPKPTSFAGDIGRDAGALFGDYPIYHSSKSPASGFAITSMLGQYNKLKRKKKPIEFGDIPGVLAQGLKGAVTGQAFALGGFFGTKFANKVAPSIGKLPLLNRVSKEDLAENLGKFIGRPLADSIMLTGMTAYETGEFPTAREFTKNILMSYTLESMQRKKEIGKKSDVNKFIKEDIESVKLEESFPEAKSEGKLVSDYFSAESSTLGRELHQKYSGIKDQPINALDDHLIAGGEIIDKGGLRAETLNGVILKEGLSPIARIQRAKEVPKKMSEDTAKKYKENLSPEQNIGEVHRDFQDYEKEVNRKRRSPDNPNGITKAEAGRLLEQPRKEKNDFIQEVKKEFMQKAEDNVIPLVEAEVGANITAGLMSTSAKAKAMLNIKNYSREILRTMGKTYHDLIVLPERQAFFNAQKYSNIKIKDIDSFTKKYSTKELAEVHKTLHSEQGYKGDDGTIINTGRETLDIQKVEYKHRDDLSSEQKAYIDYLDKNLAEVFGQMNASRKVSGLPEIKPLFGDGGSYIPVFRRFSTAERLGDLNGNWNSHEYQKTHSKGITNRFTRRRKKSTRAVDLDVINGYKKYMTNAYKEIHVNPVTAMVKRYLRPMAVPAEMQGRKINGETVGKIYDMKKSNPQAHEFISKHIDYVEGKAHKHLRGTVSDYIATKINKNIALSILSGNVSTVLNQHGAIDGTLTEFGMKYVGVGLNLALNNKAIAYMMKHSRHMSTRVMDVHTEVPGGDTGRFKKATNKLGEIGLRPMKYMDAWSSAITWHSAHAYARGELGLTGRKAINSADEAVIRVQGSANASDVAWIQTSSWGKAVSLFQTFGINKFNWYMDDMMMIGKEYQGDTRVLGHKVKNKNTARAVKMAGMLASGAFVNSMYDVTGAVFGQEFRSPNSQPLTVAFEQFNERRATAQKEGRNLELNDYMGILWHVFGELATNVPLGGSAIKYGSEGMYGATAKVLTELVDAISLGSKTDKRWGKLLFSLGSMKGIPGMNQFFKILIQDKKKIKKLLEEERARKREDRANSFSSFERQFSTFGADEKEFIDYGQLRVGKKLVGEAK